MEAMTYLFDLIHTNLKFEKIRYYAVGESNHGGTGEWICQKSFENLNVSVSNPEILSYQAIPQQFKDEFLNGTFYKSFRFYDQDAPISLSCSFDTETEDQFDEYTRPKIHFFLGSK